MSIVDTLSRNFVALKRVVSSTKYTEGLPSSCIISRKTRELKRTFSDPGDTGKRVSELSTLWHCSHPADIFSRVLRVSEVTASCPAVFNNSYSLMLMGMLIVGEVYLVDASYRMYMMVYTSQHINGCLFKKIVPSTHRVLEVILRCNKSMPHTAVYVVC